MPVPLAHTADRGGCLAPARDSRGFFPPGGRSDPRRNGWTGSPSLNAIWSAGRRIPSQSESAEPSPRSTIDAHRPRSDRASRSLSLSIPVPVARRTKVSISQPVGARRFRCTHVRGDPLLVGLRLVVESIGGMVLGQGPGSYQGIHGSLLTSRMGHRGPIPYRGCRNAVSAVKSRCPAECTKLRNLLPHTACSLACHTSGPFFIRGPSSAVARARPVSSTVAGDSEGAS